MIPITILGSFAIIISGILTYLIISKNNELRRRSTELKCIFEKLECADIKPDHSWPAWARKNYEMFFTSYREVFDWCAYRMEHRILSEATISRLENKFYWLYQEQQNLKRLIETIENVQKVPDIKIALEQEMNLLRDRIKLLHNNSPLKNRFCFIEARLSRIDTQNRDNFNEEYESMKYINRDINDLKKILEESSYPGKAG